jgi:Rieske Fe-S protein
MDRRSFISDISFSVVAACAGCLASCAKEHGGAQTGPPAGVNISVDLNSEITNVGNSVIKQGVIIVRLAATNDATSFTAVQANCTHEGSIIGFNTTQGIFICPNHGSQFNTTGSVILGPATSNLKKYIISVNGASMTVNG